MIILRDYVDKAMETNQKILKSAMKSLEYLFKFIVQSRNHFARWIYLTICLNCSAAWCPIQMYQKITWKQEKYEEYTPVKSHDLVDVVKWFHQQKQNYNLLDC